MTSLYFTIDTEYSAGHFRRSVNGACAENFVHSIVGEVGDGTADLFYQMGVHERHGQKAVFCVDPMPALLWGKEVLADIVVPIVASRHGVQWNMDCEWLECAGTTSPLPSQERRDSKDFILDQQSKRLKYAFKLLTAAGAPASIAFRAAGCVRWAREYYPC